MLTFRSRLLLVLMIASGLGIGLLSPWAEGLYSAVCLFLLPIFVALAGISIITDFNEKPRKAKATPAAKDQPAGDWPRAA